MSSNCTYYSSHYAVLLITCFWWNSSFFSFLEISINCWCCSCSGNVMCINSCVAGNPWNWNKVFCFNFIVFRCSVSPLFSAVIAYLVNTGSQETIDLISSWGSSVVQYIFHHLILVGDAVPTKVARWIPQGSKFRFGSLCIFFLEWVT